MPDQNSSRGAGDAGQAMMLSQPETPVTQPFAVPGQIKGVAKRLGGRANGKLK